MNIVQKIRASHLNRHGFLDVLAGLVLFQSIYTTLVFSFGNTDLGTEDANPMSMCKLIFLSLVIAPYLENLLLIGIAGAQEKMFGRKGIFWVAPLVLTALHFLTPKELPMPLFIRVLTLYGYFSIFLKQYDLHKKELGKHKALLLSSFIHSAVNASTFAVGYFLDLEIAAETTFSAQPGE